MAYLQALYAKIRSALNAYATGGLTETQKEHRSDLQSSLIEIEKMIVNHG